MRERPQRHWLATTAIACTFAAACSSHATSQTKGTPVKMIRTACFIGDPHAWLTGAQAEDGSFPGADRKPSVTMTCLTTLALLADGSTMRAGPDKKAIRNAVRWLIAQQRPDGSFHPGGKNSTRQHGLVTYTLVEAAGLSEYRLLWNKVAPALKTTLALRNNDGGWSCDSTQKTSDAETTAWCALACMSARFFQHAAPGQPQQEALVGWFHRHPAKTTKHAAMELYCRVIADKKPSDRTDRARPPHTLASHPLAERMLAEASLKDPDECYWVSNALYAAGGEHWKAWQPKLKMLESTRNTDFESEHYKTWPPSNGLGRTTTSILRVLTMQAYYRYTRLIR